MTAVFQVDEAPFPTLTLNYKIENNMANFDTEEFNLVFYQVEIEKIWDNPTEESDFQEF